MYHIVVFGVLALALPRVQVVGAAVGKAVVARGKNNIIAVHDAGSDLCIGVLAALGGEQGDAHEVFIP